MKSSIFYRILFVLFGISIFSLSVNANQKSSETLGSAEYPFIEKIIGCWSSTTNPLTLCIKNIQFDSNWYYYIDVTSLGDWGPAGSASYYRNQFDNHIKFLSDMSNEQFVVYEFIFTTGKNTDEKGYIRLNKTIPGMLELGHFNESGVFQRHSKLIPASNFKNIKVNTAQEALDIFLGKWTSQDFDTPENYFYKHKQQAVFTFENTGAKDEPFYKMRFFDIDKNGSLLSQKKSADVIFNDKETKIVDDQGILAFTTASAKQYFDPESKETKTVLFVNFTAQYCCLGRFAIVYPDRNSGL